MKILQLGKFYPIRGGVEKVMYDLMEGLSSRGIDCDMMCAACEGHRGEVRVNEHGRVLTYHSWKKIAGTTIAPSMLWSLRKLCKQYDLIHVHHPDPMVALALWLSGYKGKVVLHWHSDIVDQKMALKLYMPLQNWLIRRADKIIGTTPVYLKESPHLQQAQDKTVCVPIGIERVQEVGAESIARLKARYPSKKLVFSLGRLVPYKGYDYLIEAGQYIDDDCMILIGGTGPLREKLEKKITDLGLEDKVRLLGRISDEELPVYYHACDIYCMSSVKKTEAFGIVQIEAMSCGKPLIATNIPESGVSWVNKHGVSGLNVAPMNAKELATAIKNILVDQTAYNNFVEGSRKRFDEVFHIDKMVDGCLDVYKDILSRKRI